jgi:ABC-type transport system substrate-binding protein
MTRLPAFLFLAALSANAADPNRGREAPGDPKKVLRYAFEIAETSFDTQKISDLYSNIVNNAMFDTPLRYDYLARPPKLKPNTVEALPEISADGLTYTFKVKPGIYFADDAVFKGKKRELVAQDYVYTFKRLLDPKVRASQLGEFEPTVAGAAEVLAKARKSNSFDYDAPVEGIKLVDRYTFQVKLVKPTPTFIYLFGDCRIACALAREVVEHYGEDIGSHPVGTGPYRLAFWKRSSKMVLEANPNYREEYWDGEPPPGDEAAAALLKQMKGKRIPIIGRIEISVIEETQPRWLAFLNEEMDLMYQVPEEFANQAMPMNKLAKNLERRGIQMEQLPALDYTYAFFNMEDPVIGGYTPDKVALRRAITLSYNVKDEIAIIRKGQAVPAQTPYPMGVAGADPNFRTTANEYNVPKARALLDMFGYVDRDGDGYRELPDGTPLVLRFNSSPTARDQQIDELWKRSLDDIGVRLAVRKAKWPDLLKEAYAGKLMMWSLGGTASIPDADTALQTLYGPNAGHKGNMARFQLAEYDRIYEKAHAMADSPERTKLYQDLARLVVAYAPWKINTHRIRTDLWYPWVIGYRRQQIASTNWWKYIDVDRTRTAQTVTQR